MLLKRQGYYKEMPHGDETDPSIMDSINRTITEKEKICNYLENGEVLAACSRIVTDIITPEKGIIGAPDDMTDGVYLWPADLAYYVNEYNLKLPDEFIAHMKNNNWTVPNDIVIDYDDIEVI